MQEESNGGNVRLERQVRRWDWSEHYGEMQETELDGDWVKWSDVDPLLSRLFELEETVKRMKADAGYPTFEDMRTAEERERRRLVPIVYRWAFPNSKPGMHEEDMAELAEAMGVYDHWDHERRHICEAMRLMRDSGADKREYVVYAVLSSALST